MNSIQNEAVQWLLLDDAEREATRFDTQLKFMVLAGNPQLYAHIWPEKDEEGITWLTPESAEEVESLMQMLDAPMIGSETD